jgi:hypothetical protein
VTRSTERGDHKVPAAAYHCVSSIKPMSATMAPESLRRNGFPHAELRAERPSSSLVRQAFKDEVANRLLYEVARAAHWWRDVAAAVDDEEEEKALEILRAIGADENLGTGERARQAGGVRGDDSSSGPNPSRG